MDMAEGKARGTADSLLEDERVVKVLHCCGGVPFHAGGREVRKQNHEWHTDGISFVRKGDAE